MDFNEMGCIRLQDCIKKKKKNQWEQQSSQDKPARYCVDGKEPAAEDRKQRLH